MSKSWVQPSRHPTDDLSELYGTSAKFTITQVPRSEDACLKGSYLPETDARNLLLQGGYPEGAVIEITQRNRKTTVGIVQGEESTIKRIQPQFLHELYTLPPTLPRLERPRVKEDLFAEDRYYVHL